MDWGSNIVVVRKNLFLTDIRILLFSIARIRLARTFEDLVEDLPETIEINHLVCARHGANFLDEAGHVSIFPKLSYIVKQH